MKICCSGVIHVDVGESLMQAFSKCIIIAYDYHPRHSKLPRGEITLIKHQAE